MTHPLATVAALLVHRLDKTDVLAQSLDSFVDTAMRVGHRRSGFEHDVFISSTAETSDLAKHLGQLLSQAGLRVVDSSSSTWDEADQRRLDRPSTSSASQ